MLEAASQQKSGIEQLVQSGDVQNALRQAGVQGDANALLKAAGGDPEKVLKAAGVDTKSLLSSAGLPSEATALLSLPKVFSGKGTDKKVQAVADGVQSLLNQQSGAIGQAGDLATSSLSKALGVKIHGAGKVGGAVGSAAGTALIGPVGGEVGQVIGSFVGEGIRAVFLELGIGLTAKQKRERREKNRQKDDAGRIRDYQNRFPDTKTPEGMYRAFTKGLVVTSTGTVGTQKWHERQRWIMRNGTVVQIKDKAEFDRIVKDPRVLRLASNKASQAMIKSMLDVESRMKPKVDPKAQQKAREEVAKLKGALVKGLTQAARNLRAKQAGKPSTAAKPAAKRLAGKKPAAKLPSAAVAKIKKQLAQTQAAKAKAQAAERKAKAALEAERAARQAAQASATNEALRAAQAAQAQAAAAVAEARATAAAAQAQMQAAALMAEQTRLALQASAQAPQTVLVPWTTAAATPAVQAPPSALPPLPDEFLPRVQDINPELAPLNTSADSELLGLFAQWSR
jgi:hypothetical protein